MQASHEARKANKARAVQHLTARIATHIEVRVCMFWCGCARVFLCAVQCVTARMATHIEVRVYACFGVGACVFWCVLCNV
jgi:hypothetical protein